MGITSIAVFSDADSEGLYVKEADLAVHIGGSNPSDSYLNIDKIIEVANRYGADAIHPGYGFLSENAGFTERCQKEGIVFIGPHAGAIEAMGSKSKAKALMIQHDVPVIPGYQGEDQSVERLIEEAQKIGFPLLLKATAGGGGKGMRIVREESELASQIASAQREALAAFGDDELIIEKYISQGRHIEFQIFGDKHGNAIHILERECTIQRRYQKVLEESPSPALTDTLRQEMGDAAVRAAKALNYDNAGTVEFIFDESNGSFYFLEVNTRLQVEHPVTEEITGLDLVKMQIEVAESNPLSVRQDDINSRGYAIEARLYAEDPAHDFTPSTGIILLWDIPQVEGLRIETAVETGSRISIHYDPMIAKMIVWDETRSGAHRKMLYILRHLKCMGITTNQDFLLHLFEQENVQKGDYTTHYIDQYVDFQKLDSKTEFQLHLTAIASTLFQWNHRNVKRTLLRNLPSGWRNNRYSPQQDNYRWGEDSLDVKYISHPKNRFTFQIGQANLATHLVEVTGSTIVFRTEGVQYHATVVEEGNNCFIHMPETGNVRLVKKDRFPAKEKAKVEGGYEAPMPSQIVKILIEPGQKVQVDDPLMIISSMKMENTLTAEKNGKVSDVFVKEGQNVEAGYLLLTVE